MVMQMVYQTFKSSRKVNYNLKKESDKAMHSNIETPLNVRFGLYEPPPLAVGMISHFHWHDGVISTLKWREGMIWKTHVIMKMEYLRRDFVIL